MLLKYYENRNCYQLILTGSLTDFTLKMHSFILISYLLTVMDIVMTINIWWHSNSLKIILQQSIYWKYIIKFWATFLHQDDTRAKKVTIKYKVIVLYDLSLYLRVVWIIYGKLIFLHFTVQGMFSVLKL